jgi:hypothetical protein
MFGSSKVGGLELTSFGSIDAREKKTRPQRQRRVRHSTPLQKPQEAPGLRNAKMMGVVRMTTSKRFAKLIGPTIVALTMSEAVNLRTMLNNPAPIVLVYLNGTLLFIAGLAIVRDHNRWKYGWPVLVTVVGWLLILGGLIRMFAPVFAQQEVQHPTPVYVGLFIGLAAGIFLTFKGYSRDDSKTGTQA